MEPTSTDTSRRAHDAALLGLVAANAIAALWPAATYFRARPPDTGAAASALVAVALVAEIWTVLLAVALALLVAGRWRRLRGALRVAAPLAFAALLVLLWLDGKVLAIFGFHLNGIVLDLVVAPGGIESLEIQRAEVATFVAALAALLVAEAGAHALLLARARRREPGVAARDRWKLAAAVALTLVAFERGAYALAPRAAARDLARASAVVPTRAIGASLARATSRAPRTPVYPRAPLRGAAPARPPNLVFVVIESWRRDTLRPDLTPRISAFAADAEVFAEHLSGGNGTYLGVFTLFYGLHGTYADAFADAHRGPVLLERARALGYDVRVIAARTLRYPRLRDNVFADVAAHVDDDVPGATSDARDVEVVARARRFLDTRDAARPFLLAVFLDSTHLPYSFPPDRAPHRPYTERLFYAVMDEPQPREPIWNRYLNALSWVDEQAGALLDHLRGRGLLANTVVVVTGDHGQEFYEHGTLGHIVHLDREMTAAPLVMRIPGRSPAVHRGPSRHVDVVATVLPMLGVENPPSDYCQGVSLLDPARPDHAVTCGFRECAIVAADGWATLFPPFDADRPIEIRDPDYRPSPSGRPSPYLRATLASFGAFAR